ncbi:hypothetical protein N1495_05245 [Streptococcus didelphis]|uniref:Fe/B12 periplasmic-binding domain-containing protein n=1 Tax=Streptococcus didelphis TaxID=102886 RepID=A0ABY9LIX7_9STRE|nr:hypothetical protein [Streptococcus didelphis]WMB28779.1 hypothetical protein N1496_00825 [Streptococcus didelphis]WMB30178.1 hypothetical protein N1495_05245 [Streptococcus didelphis]
MVAVPKAQNGLKMFDKKTQKIYEKSSYRDAGSLFEPNFEVVAELQPDLIMIGGRTATVQNIEQLKKQPQKQLYFILH